MPRLAILSTHPVQYNVPLFRILASDPKTSLHVFFTKTEKEFRFDAEFDQEVTWDIPLTEGYLHSNHPCTTSQEKKDLIQSITAFAPNAVLIFGWNPPGHLASMRHFFDKIPVWFRGDSIMDSGIKGWKRWFRRLVLWWVYRNVDRAFYVGQRNREYFLWAGLSETQLTFAPHAVDAEFFTRDDAARREEASNIRIEMGIEQSETVFLFAGKLNVNKQPVPLAEAFLKALEDGTTNAHLIFVGSGPLEEELRLRFDCNTRIHFVGFQNQTRMPIWYRAADVLCLVSISETWGLAVNEALLCGCRVLASDSLGCLPDLAGHRIQTVAHSKHSQWPSAISNLITLAKSKSSPWNSQNLTTTANVILNELNQLAQ